MGIEDFLETEGNDEEENKQEEVQNEQTILPEVLDISEKDVNSKFSEIAEIMQPGSNVGVPEIIEEQIPEDLEYEEIEYEGYVKVSFLVDPSTLTKKDIPAITIDGMTQGLENLFGIGMTTLVSQAPSDETWDFIYKINNESPNFEFVPMTASASSALIKPSMVDGELVGEIVKAVAQGYLNEIQE